MTDICLVCDTVMQSPEPWLRECPQCRFLHSTLPAGAGTGVDGLETLRRKNFKTLLEKLSALGSLTGKTLLEVGCSTGLFLEEAQKNGIEVTGLEPEKTKADIARTKNFTVIDGFFPDAVPSGKQYDMIIFNDVFEHLPDPVAALRACNNHLASCGLLIINLPDSSGIIYNIARFFNKIGMSGPFERMWQKQFASPHITYFRGSNLQKLVEGKTPLKLVASGKLDSMTAQGLKSRIASSVVEPWATLMFVPLLAITYLQKILPSDILLHIYKKPAGY